MELRSYREADFEALFALDCVCFEEPFRFSRATMRRVVRGRGAVVVVACDGDVVIGFCATEVRRAEAYVATVDVDPGWRGRGIGRALMEEAEQRAVAAGAKVAGLHVFVGNAGAARLYEGLGYRRTGTVVGFYGRHLDAWTYGKELG